MVPAGPITERAVAELAALLEPGTPSSTGATRRYHDDIRRARELAEGGIHYVDVGTSGGVFGLERGFCLMVGGEDAAVGRLAPLFTSLAPGLDAAGRTPGEAGDACARGARVAPLRPARRGALREDGAQRHRIRPDGRATRRGSTSSTTPDAGAATREDDAETAPLDQPEHYRYDLDVAAIAEVWRRGSVVASWLLDLTAAASRSPRARGIRRPRLGLGRGTVDVDRRDRTRYPRARADGGAFSRFSSREEDEFANRLLSAMRKQFGGHQEKPVGEATRGLTGEGSGPDVPPSSAG